MRRVLVGLLMVSLLVSLFASFVGSGAAVGAEEEGGLPPECRPTQVREIFDGFTRSLNEGERETALTFVALPPEQNGFSVGAPGSDGNLLLSRRPATIYGFFARQIRRGERLRLLGGDVKPLDPTTLDSGPYRRPPEGPRAGDPVAAVSFELKMSGGKEGIRQPSGKAGINCASGQFYVWALDLGAPLEKDYGGVRVCADRPRVSALKPLRKPVMC